MNPETNLVPPAGNKSHFSVSGIMTDPRLSQNEGLTLMVILAPFYPGGVFLFSYGYDQFSSHQSSQ